MVVAALAVVISSTAQAEVTSVNSVELKKTLRAAPVADRNEDGLLTFREYERYVREQEQGHPVPPWHGASRW